MTITVLDPYKRYGIGTQLLNKAIEDCCNSKHIKKMYLHVQKGNDSAKNFYLANGFSIEKEIQGYYTDLEESDCYVLVKDVSKP